MPLPSSPFLNIIKKNQITFILEYLFLEFTQLRFKYVFLNSV